MLPAVYLRSELNDALSRYWLQRFVLCRSGTAYPLRFYC